MRLSWNRDEHGIVTVYAQKTDGNVIDVADFWVKPWVDAGLSRSVGQTHQLSIVEFLVKEWNDRIPARSNSGCWLNRSDCKGNCGSYGCGG